MVRARGLDYLHLDLEEWHCLSSATCLTASFVFYDINCLTWLIEFAALFTAFEGNLRWTSSVGHVVSPDLGHGEEHGPRQLEVAEAQRPRRLHGRRYLSNATCLTRPHLFYALFRRVKDHRKCCYFIRRF